jgi:hypothetical protein
MLGVGQGMSKSKARVTDWWSRFGVGVFLAVSGYLIVTVSLAAWHH